MLSFIFFLLTLGVVGYVAYDMVGLYRTSAATSVWGKLIDAARGSATMLWSYVVGAGGLFMTWSEKLADALNQPQVSTWISGNLSPTKVGAAMLVITLVTIVARLRTLSASV